MARLSKAGELAFQSIAGLAHRVINASDATEVCDLGLAINLGAEGYQLTDAGKRRAEKRAAKGDE